MGFYDGRLVEFFLLLNGVLINFNCEFESNFIVVYIFFLWLRDFFLFIVEELMSIDLKVEKLSSLSEFMEEDLFVSIESDRESNCEKDIDRGVV